jgi:hypothetical protein
MLKTRRDSYFGLDHSHTCQQKPNTSGDPWHSPFKVLEPAAYCKRKDEHLYIVPAACAAVKESRIQIRGQERIIIIFVVRVTECRNRQEKIKLFLNCETRCGKTYKVKDHSKFVSEAQKFRTQVSYFLQ